jgi:ribosomal protein S1
MPRKKIVPDEEQVNELEPQVTEEAVEGLEQSVTDLPQEDVSPPVTEEPPPPEPPPPEEPTDAPEEPSAMQPFWMEPESPPIPPPDPDPPSPPPKSDRQNFYGLDFNALDRDLTAEERQEWNSIYASYRGRSALTGTIIGVDPLHVSVRNRETGTMEKKTMYCAIVVPYRVRVVIPDTEMWEQEQARPDFVLRNMVGATIDFIIIKVDRENGVAVASRRMAARSQRYFFAHRPALHRIGAQVKCRVLSVGPRRCLVECYGHDIDLTQRDLRYTAIPDLREEYHPGQELDCAVTGFDPEKGSLQISVKATQTDPFDGAEQRHPVGSRRYATIAGKYGGGVFCNLPDGTVCMCSYSYQYEDADFMVGDTVIVLVQRFAEEKRQMYGKIVSKW